MIYWSFQPLLRGWESCDESQGGKIGLGIDGYDIGWHHLTRVEAESPCNCKLYAYYFQTRLHVRCLIPSLWRH